MFFFRFADILGLDISETRVFADEIPKVPKQAFEDLDAKKIDKYWSGCKASPLLPKKLIPQPVQLIPTFPEPGFTKHFPELVKTGKICLERASMTGPTTLTGDVRVMNMAFDKSVTAIWTVDDWVNKIQTKCEYVQETDNYAMFDKFQFKLETAGLAVGSRLHLCFRYLSSGLEFWDNNGGRNYIFKVDQRSEKHPEFEIEFL